MIPGVNQREKNLSQDGFICNTDITNSAEHKLLIVTVGLPARGKSFVSQKLARYLDWLGFSSKVFDICTYRKQILGKFYNHDWYDPDNYEVCQKCRNEKTLIIVITKRVPKQDQKLH